MAEGKFESGIFYLIQIKHPPLHANKQLKFQLNEQDYFGSYSKMTEQMMDNKPKTEAPKEQAETNLEQCVVIISQIEIDKAKHSNALEQMFRGLDDMCPEIIVLMGNFLTRENSENQSTDKIKHHFEALGQMIRNHDMLCLRDQTQWVIMGS